MPRCVSYMTQLTCAVLWSNMFALWLYDFDVEKFFEAVGLMDINSVDEAFAYVISEKLG